VPTMQVREIGFFDVSWQSLIVVVAVATFQPRRTVGLTTNTEQHLISTGGRGRDHRHRPDWKLFDHAVIDL